MADDMMQACKHSLRHHPVKGSPLLSFYHPGLFLYHAESHVECFILNQSSVPVHIKAQMTNFLEFSGGDMR